MSFHPRFYSNESGDMSFILDILLVSAGICYITKALIIICGMLYNKITNYNKKSIYVAGSWVQRKILHNKMLELRKAGYIVTSNWPLLEDKIDNPDDYAECSKRDIKGVLTADILLVFMTDPNYPYRGTFTEIGCAIGSGKRIILICDGTIDNISDTVNNVKNKDKYNLSFSHDCMKNVFFWDPHIEHVATYEDALRLIKGENVTPPYKTYYAGKISDNLTNCIKQLNN